jgi:hypothetical protein
VEVPRSEDRNGLERGSALRPWQPLDAERDFRQHRLWYCDLRPFGCRQSIDNGVLPFMSAETTLVSRT